MFEGEGKGLTSFYVAVDASSGVRDLKQEDEWGLGEICNTRWSWVLGPSSSPMSRQSAIVELRLDRRGPIGIGADEISASDLRGTVCGTPGTSLSGSGQHPLQAEIELLDMKGGASVERAESSPVSNERLFSGN